MATKYSNAAAGNDPNAGGNQRKNMVQACEASLQRLQTDYIDLYWMHIWDQITAARRSDACIRRSRRQGKVLYIGVSTPRRGWPGG